MLYRRGNSSFWWIRFKFKGNLIQQSSKSTNKRIAAQIEAALKTQYAKGEVGIEDKKAPPTLARFIDQEFLPYVRNVNAAKPQTVRAYEYHCSVLKANLSLGPLSLDKITVNIITAHAAGRRETCQVSTCNRDLACLRRIFKLAEEWGKVSKALPRVRLLQGENRRERVISPEEEKKYLEAAPPLLKDVATLLFDLGLRPEECFRLTPENYRDHIVTIFKGKGRGSRRRIPCSTRAIEVLDRRNSPVNPWVFPAPTKTGHVDGSSVKKQHAKAIKASGVAAFVLYDIRHTAITRWSKKVDAFTLHNLAGHISMATTQRYVHPSDEAARGILS
jgi:integrase